MDGYNFLKYSFIIIFPGKKGREEMGSIWIYEQASRKDHIQDDVDLMGYILPPHALMLEILYKFKLKERTNIVIF